jgi:hypothetical protein
MTMATMTGSGHRPAKVIRPDDAGRAAAPRPACAAAMAGIYALRPMALAGIAA